MAETRRKDMERIKTEREVMLKMLKDSCRDWRHGYYPHCLKNSLIPVDNEDLGKFLNYHQRQCTLKSPRKRVVVDEPVGLEEFEARLDASRAPGLKSSAQTSRQSMKC